MNVVPEDLEAYAAAHSSPEADGLAALAAETREVSDAHGMMVGVLEGRLLEFLVFMTGARRVLEIGTFTGYSALSMAAALPPDGRIVTCDIDPVTSAVARRHAASSPVGDRIEFRLGPALDTIATLDGPFDLVFIDADKESYLAYYEALLPKLADRGVIVVDNVLWDGRVLDPADETADTRAIRAFNEAAVADPRVVAVMLTVRDGITLLRRVAAEASAGPS
ncbi:MAG TPA: class I SAM-dependent methyltransferase [Acidimicrobiales bacterium]|nr:class I SAM-dependent methyltransferase [Acidimicrobiales bacterium]